VNRKPPAKRAKSSLQLEDLTIRFSPHYSVYLPSEILKCLGFGHTFGNRPLMDPAEAEVNKKKPPAC
jgi:hypothetical protein